MATTRRGEKHYGLDERSAYTWDFVYIGIDQSLTGFAVSIVNADDVSQHCTWVYKSPYNGVQRLDDISEWLVEKIHVYPVNDIAMENTVRASYAALVLGELAATVKLTLWRLFDASYQIAGTPLLIAPTMVKKFAAGSGTAKKTEMLLQIYKRWGVEFSDDNAADAYALARIASGVAVGAVEREILAKIAKEEYRDQIR